MSGRDRTTVFWIRYARLRRNRASITDWPGYRLMLISQAENLISHGADHSGAIAAGLARLKAGTDLGFVPSGGFEHSDPPVRKRH